MPTSPKQPATSLKQGAKGKSEERTVYVLQDSKLVPVGTCISFEWSYATEWPGLPARTWRLI